MQRTAIFALVIFLVGGQAFAQNVVSTTRSESNWSGRYKNYMNGPEFQNADGASINHYVRTRYQFNREFKVEGVFRADSNFGNDNPVWSLEDSFIKIMYPTIARSADRRLKVYGDFRYYAPISEGSRADNINGKIATRLYSTYDVGRWSLVNIIIPEYYLNTQSVDGLTQMKIGNFFQTSYNLSPTFRLVLAFYPKWSKAIGGVAEFNDLTTYPGVEFDFAPNLHLNPYVEFKLMDPQLATTRLGGLLRYRFI